MGGDRYCGFCGKHETEVARLIAGPIANICNECVELQHGMLNEDPSRKRSLHEVLSRARQRRISELEAENRRLREALQHIADPIKYLQQKADAEGTVVNGAQAVAMSKDPEYLKQIARAALSQEDRDGT